MKNQKNSEKDLIGPMLLTGSLNAEGFEGWLNQYLLPSLKIPSVLIMNNAPIHTKNVIKELVESAGHQVLFLPKYSPDLNDIEHDFSALNKAIIYVFTNTFLVNLFVIIALGNVSFLFETTRNPLFPNKNYV